MHSSKYFDLEGLVQSQCAAGFCTWASQAASAGTGTGVQVADVIHTFSLGIWALPLSLLGEGQRWQ